MWEFKLAIIIEALGDGFLSIPQKSAQEYSL